MLQHVKNVEQALHMSESSLQGMARSMSLEEVWQNTQTVSFMNTSIKHAVIAMADVGSRAVHACIRTLRAQALSIGTAT